MTGQLPGGGGDRDALDIDPGHALGALHGLGDGLSGLIDIDDGAAAHAVGLDIADASRGQGAIAPADAIGLHDEAGDLGGAEVHRRNGAGSAEAGLESFPALALLHLGRRGPMLENFLRHLDPISRR